MGKGHARNEDTYLNKGGVNEVTTADAKDTVINKHDPAVQFNRTVSGEINTLTEKTTPIANDLILIEDSADSLTKKKVKLTNLPLITTLNNNSKVKVGSNTLQPVGAYSWIKVGLQSETFDLLNEFDNVTNYRFTALNTGYYKVSALIFHVRTSGASLPSGWLAIYKGGLINAQSYYSFSQVYSTCIVGDTIKLNAGQYLEVYLYCIVPTQISDNPTIAYFTVTRV